MTPAVLLRHALETHPRPCRTFFDITSTPRRQGLAFFWRDCLAHESGSLGLVPYEQADETHRLLRAELERWRTGV